MLAQRGSAHFAQRSYAGTKVTRPPRRDPAGWHATGTRKTRQAERPQWAANRQALHAAHLPRMVHSAVWQLK